MYRLLNSRPTSSLMSETSFRVSTSLEPYCPRKPDSFHTLLIWTTLLSTLSLLGWRWSIKQFFLWTSLQFTLIFFSEEWDLIRDFGSLGSILSPKTRFILHLFVMNQLLGEPTTITSRTLLFLGRMRFDVWFQLLRIHTTSKTWFFFTPFCYKLPLTSFEYSSLLWGWWSITFWRATNFFNSHLSPSQMIKICLGVSAFRDITVSGDGLLFTPFVMNHPGDFPPILEGQSFNISFHFALLFFSGEWDYLWVFVFQDRISLQNPTSIWSQSQTPYPFTWRKEKYFPTSV